MPYDVELPKWPRLLVRGRNVRPEQADLVIIRTTCFAGGLDTGDRQVKAMLRRAFGVTAGPDSSDWWSEWDRVATELGALDTQYVWNDHLGSHHVDGAHGWVSWGGQVFSRGMSLLSKWPSIGEVTDDWRRIAHAFPFLDLTAQLVEERWDEEYERVEAHRALVTWDIGRGVAELRQDPGDPLFPPPDGTREELFDLKYAKGWPKETNVRERRLRAAVERCRRRTVQGK